MYAKVLNLASRLGLNPVVNIDDPRRAEPLPQVANPVHFSAPAVYRSAPPKVGEDRDEVIAMLRGNSGALNT